MPTDLEVCQNCYNFAERKIKTMGKKPCCLSVNNAFNDFVKGHPDIEKSGDLMVAVKDAMQFMYTRGYMTGYNDCLTAYDDKCCGEDDELEKQTY